MKTEIWTENAHPAGTSLGKSSRYPIESERPFLDMKSKATPSAFNQNGRTIPAGDKIHENLKFITSRFNNRFSEENTRIQRREKLAARVRSPPRVRLGEVSHVSSAF